MEPAATGAAGGAARRRRVRRAPTIRDVAREAGVGIGTASRALGSGQLVSEETRARVVAAARRVGYRPSRAAKVLRGVRARVIGVMIPDLSLPLYAQWLRAAGDAARRHGYVLLVCDGQNSAHVIEQQLERLYEEQIDGLVVAGPIHGLPHVARFAESGIPVVPDVPSEERRKMRGSELRERAERSGALRAFRRLVELGHRRIAYLAYVERDARYFPPMQRVRVGCLERALAEVGVKHDAELVVTAADTDECRARTRALLDAPEPPTAIVAGTEALTPAVLAAIGDAGLAIPRDVSVLGFGDSLWEQAFRPPISVVRLDYRLAGVAMVDNLVARIEGKRPVPPLPELESEFVERGSFAPPRERRRYSTSDAKTTPGSGTRKKGAKR